MTKTISCACGNRICVSRQTRGDLHVCSRSGLHHWGCGRVAFSCGAAQFLFEVSVGYLLRMWLLNLICQLSKKGWLICG